MRGFQQGCDEIRTLREANDSWEEGGRPRKTREEKVARVRTRDEHGLNVESLAQLGLKQSCQGGRLPNGTSCRHQPMAASSPSSDQALGGGALALAARNAYGDSTEAALTLSQGSTPRYKHGLPSGPRHGRVAAAALQALKQNIFLHSHPRHPTPAEALKLARVSLLTQPRNAS